MTEKIVYVGTVSPLELRAVATALAKLGMSDYEVESVNAASNVRSQPFGLGEILHGARHRAQHGALLGVIGIGIENGLVNDPEGNWFDAACVYVTRPHFGSSHAYSTFFPIPSWMVEYIFRYDTELGHVVQNANGGEKDPMKWLSENAVKREDILMQAIICAFTPLLNTARYDGSDTGNLVRDLRSARQKLLSKE